MTTIERQRELTSLMLRYFELRRQVREMRSTLENGRREKGLSVAQYYHAQANPADADTIQAYVQARQVLGALLDQAEEVLDGVADEEEVIAADEHQEFFDGESLIDRSDASIC
ncbi:hypothetical protein ACQ3G6_12860 [Allorhizobium undicola]|uniref:hypothetical protein n=1 Tax=Allorhizobium undicola TaxID=78527 RepID=UPI003D328C73